MKLVIVHYHALEYYPPITNLLDVWAAQNNQETFVFSTKNNKERAVYSNDKIKIIRFLAPKDDWSVIRLLKYFAFNISVLLYLIKIHPKKIFYFETNSSFPVYLYRKYFNKNVEIYIHNHEYYSPEWYLKFMKLIRYYHKLEFKYLYRKAKWISQTNKERLQLFSIDNSEIKKEVLQVLPNYPPLKWQNYRNTTPKINPNVKFVYIGSLSIDSTYLCEFTEWVIKQNGKVSFDIYSYNIHPDSLNYLKNINVDYIKVYEKGIEYNDIPNVLNGYDVGILFYKPVTLNYKFNAPNKLFEYLTSGLDVWFSKELQGCYEFKTNNTFPKVIQIDFENLDDLDINTVTSRAGMTQHLTSYNCEAAVKPLIKSIFDLQ